MHQEKIVSIIANKKSVHEHLFNCAQLQIKSCLNVVKDNGHFTKVTGYKIEHNYQIIEEMFCL